MALANDPADRSIPPLTWTAVADLIRLRNQSGTWLLMLPSLWSLVLAAHGRPSMALMGIFMLGAFVMRSLGVVFNDLADRDFDREVTRTSGRPLADGRLVPHQALIIALTLAISAGLLVWTLNSFTILLSPIALFLAAIYPFSKRWIHLPQAVLGIAFGWGAIMAWAASCGRIDPPAWLLFGATICWALAYDTIYALQDRDDDRRIGIKSSALYFGKAVPSAVGFFLAGMVVCLALAGQVSNLQVGYYTVLVIVAGLFWWQVERLKVSVTPGSAAVMFRQHVYAGMLILLGIWIGTI